MTRHPAFSSLVAGAEIPTVERAPSAVDLFMFSAAAWLLHRIHYDTPYTTEEQGHPALLIHGPLQGVYMSQCAASYLGPGARLASLEYRHQAPAYLGDRLECGGSVAGVDPRSATVEIDLWVRNQDGSVTTQGRGVFAYENGQQT